MEIGKPAPAFDLPATGDRTISLASLRGKKVVLYFYPKDSTPGCTKEGQAFRDFYPVFTEHGAEVLGVSRDSIRSHENFAAKQEFPFPLLSDKEEELCKAYDVIKEKNMYGRKVMGIERSTFVIDPQGNLAREWRKVKVNGHVDEVLEYIKGL